MVKFAVWFKFALIPVVRLETCLTKFRARGVWFGNVSIDWQKIRLAAVYVVVVLFVCYQLRQ